MIIDWLSPALVHVKALHIAALSIWCAGLLALPLMLARHDPAVGQQDYARIRKATHYGYAFAVTPAAVLAIGSGTVLIFMREAFVLWLFAKLVCVALLVAGHAWVGHTLVHVAETAGVHEPPEPPVPLAFLTVVMLAILALVLAKPELSEIPMPGWLGEPLGLQLPFDVPRR